MNWKKFDYETGKVPKNGTLCLFNVKGETHEYVLGKVDNIYERHIDDELTVRVTDINPDSLGVEAEIVGDYITHYCEINDPLLGGGPVTQIGGTTVGALRQP